MENMAGWEDMVKVQGAAGGIVVEEVGGRVPREIMAVSKNLECELKKLNKIG